MQHDDDRESAVDPASHGSKEASAPPPPPVPPPLVPPQSPVPLAPPTSPGELPVRRPSWPTIIGVIALVIGIIGVITSAWGVVMPLLFSSFDRGGGPFSTAASVPKGGWLVATVIANIVGIVVSGLLVIGSALLLRWSRGSVRVLRIYAISALVLAPVGMIIGIVPAMQNLEQTLGPGGPPLAVMLPLMVVFMLLGLALASALPIFLLVWFSRKKIKMDMDRWFDGGARAT